MATITEDEKQGMSEKDQKQYCDWCWYKDYGDCSKCALLIHKSAAQEVLPFA